jgi:DNA-binding IclR family transcriptional regulator
MPESETQVVFRILGVLAKARDLGHTLPVEKIADAAHLGRPNAEHYMTVLQHAGAVRAEAAATPTPEYRLTRYGLERLAGSGARRSGPTPSEPFLTPA